MRAAVMRVAAVPTGRDRQREAKHEPSENYSGTESRNGYTEPSNLFCDLSKLPPDVAGIWFHISMLIHLHFHGPFSVCSETDDVLANCPLRSGTGIYLWAVKQSRAFTALRTLAKRASHSMAERRNTSSRLWAAIIE